MKRLDICHVYSDTLALKLSISDYFVVKKMLRNIENMPRTLAALELYERLVDPLPILLCVSNFSIVSGEKIH